MFFIGYKYDILNISKRGEMKGPFTYEYNVSNAVVGTSRIYVFTCRCNETITGSGILFTMAVGGGGGARASNACFPSSSEPTDIFTNTPLLCFIYLINIFLFIF